MEKGSPGLHSGLTAKKRRKENKRKRQKAVETATVLQPTPNARTSLVRSANALLEDGSTVVVTATSTCIDSQKGPNPRGDTRKRSVFSGKKRPRETDGFGPLSGVSEHPFPTEYGDHFETPLEAYRDVEGALALLAKRLGKKRKHLRIWDPYYCAGRTPRLLSKLGFPKVEHSNQDFYKVIQENRQPNHDVLVTNPPYSGDHKKRCLQYCRASGKPWFLLIPNYVATKDYYRLSVLGSAAGPGGEPFYVVPDTKYPFDHPEGTGHAHSPFFGVWFVQCGSHTEAVFEGTKAENRGGVCVVRSLEELGRAGAVKTERRMNPRQRKAIKKKRIAAAAGGGA